MAIVAGLLGPFFINEIPVVICVVAEVTIVFNFPFLKFLVMDIMNIEIKFKDRKVDFYILQLINMTISTYNGTSLFILY